MRSYEERLEFMAKLDRLNSDGAWSAYEQACLKFTKARLKAEDYTDATGYLDELERKLRDKLQHVRALKALINPGEMK